MDFRSQAEQRWPNLYNLLPCFFGQDVFYEFDTLPNAIAAAAANSDPRGNRQVLNELTDWWQTVGHTPEIRSALDAYGVELDFESDDEAREFVRTLETAIQSAVDQ
jgi:hypothetical protein